MGEALKAFENSISGREFQVRSDNATAVAYLNHHGGTRSRPLLDLAKDILGWAKGRVVSVSTVHKKG